MTKGKLSEKWIKASIIGTIWATSEIVLGSFLHNLRIPFSSNLLTGIGLIILISSSYKWPERGIFWRAGLICALMKTMSPSAVIFGPMIAIFSQSLLLELFTALLGRNAMGFLAGSVFAMSWNLMHKILNFIIIYGFNIANIYSSLLKYAQFQLNIGFDLVWSPILIIAAIYAVLGLVSGAIGMRAGRQLLKQSPAALGMGSEKMSQVFEGGKANFPYSIAWLFLNIALIILSFFLLNYTAWPVWSTAIISIVLVWILRYKRALKKLARPRLWIYFVLTTMAASFVIVRIQSGHLLTGLEAGIKMNFRATIMILGFTVLGTELYNQKVRDSFARTAFRQLPLAMELSVKSLPMMIASLPEVKVLARSPVVTISSLMSQIETRLEEARQQITGHTFIITGSIGQGKTTQAMKVAALLNGRGLIVKGIYSPRILDNGVTTGYDLVDVETGNRLPLLRTDSNNGNPRVGRYSIEPETLRDGNETLGRALEDCPDVIIIDEAGRMELENGGWHDRLACLLDSSAIKVLAVRNIFVDDVISKWKIKDYTILQASDQLYLRLAGLIESKTGREHQTDGPVESETEDRKLQTTGPNHC